ncbi:MAG: translocation/assembly module TamB domain-containing protein [Proteobacteria bacterium]|nr:translocation/assembly module TamB domain-containing protein [Pseudomonadota bacterium]
MPPWLERLRLPDLGLARLGQRVGLHKLKPFNKVQWLAIGVFGVMLLVLSAGLIGRFAVLTPWGRDIVSGIVNGKSLGRWGRINVYGLKGDVWSDFTLDRVTVTDPKGVWLDARAIHVRWESAELLVRRFHARTIQASTVRFVRRPELQPEVTPPGPMPLSVKIDRLNTGVELLEGFSQDYGRLALAGDADVRRKGPATVHLNAHSITRPGDFLRLAYAAGGANGLQLDAQASEANGGPIAGALGYSPKAPFALNLQAHGKPADGRFSGFIRTGADTPLSTQGTWDAKGATASGRLALAGSTLLTPMAARLGRDLRFGLYAEPGLKDRWTLAATILADNLTARTVGVVTTAGATPEGLRIIAQTPSLTRLVGTEAAGPASFNGVLAGDIDNWRLHGQVSAAKAGFAGYSLASLSGPIDVVSRKSRQDIQVSARGAGGSGSGMLTALMGSAPTLNAKVVWLADGRVYAERFDAVGSALRVEGSGGQGLFGGLNFKGRAALTNVGLIRRGATGSVDGPFEASQSKAGQPWRFTLDARGKRFASGLGQLDRLLGPEPRLQLAGGLDKGRFDVTRAALNGTAGQANGKGLIGFDGSLKLALDWSAKGPFQAGPLEIAGNMKGDGALTGSIGAPRADLKADFDEIDLGQLQLTKSQVALTFQKDPRGYDGQVAINGASQWGPAHGRSDFRFAGDGVALEGLSVDAGGLKAQGSLALRSGSPSSADLTFAAGPGAFLTAGEAHGVVKVSDARPDPAAAVQIAGSNLQLRGSDWVFRTVRLDGKGSPARLPFSVNADVAGALPVKFVGDGVYARNGQTQTLALNGAGQARTATFKTLQPLTVAFGPGGSKAFSADLNVGGGRLTAHGREAKGLVDGRADLQGVDLAALNADFKGRVDAALVLNGRGDRLAGNLDAQLHDLHARDGPKKLTVDGTLKAVLTGGDRLHVDASAFDKGGGVKASTSVDLPVIASVTPLHLAVVKNRPLSGRYAIAGEVQPIWDLFQGGDRTLGGIVDSQGQLAGTLDRPLVEGSATLRNGRFDDSATGLSLRALTLDAAFDRNAAVVRQFSGTDGRDGKVSGQGRIELAKGGASSFTATLAGFQLLNNDIGQARASGPVTVTRAADGKIKLTGDLAVTRATFAANPPTSADVVSMDVVEINAPAGRKTFAPVRRGPGAALDVSLHAPGQVFVKGRGLNVEFALKAHVGGTTSAPVLSGAANVVRGDFNFSGKRFEFDERGTVSLSTHPEDIRLDLRAVRDDPSLTAIIQVRGTAAKPEITLASEPALPQDEVLSQVLFGTSAAQLSPIEAAQLASAVAALAGGGGFDVLGHLREFAGLDRLVFGGDQASGMTVAGGKYVSENVYLELIGGGREGGAVQVEWRLKKSLSITSRLGGEGDAKLAVRWRKDLR